MDYNLPLMLIDCINNLQYLEIDDIISLILITLKLFHFFHGRSMKDYGES